MNQKRKCFQSKARVKEKKKKEKNKDSNMEEEEKKNQILFVLKQHHCSNNILY